uniref:Uncharacterized protein n=1 Tax=Romanomermis culicivorax TaxID=13658 RepID=A0A915IPE9_ROMCU
MQWSEIWQMHNS